MLEKNRLQPPRSFETAAVGSRDMFHSPAVGSGPLFVSAEDFDATGILAGIDPSASSYWWMPELQGRELQGPRPFGPDAVTAFATLADGEPENPLRGPAHATRRTSSRSIAAA